MQRPGGGGWGRSGRLAVLVLRFVDVLSGRDAEYIWGRP